MNIVLRKVKMKGEKEGKERKERGRKGGSEEGETNPSLK